MRIRNPGENKLSTANKKSHPSEPAFLKASWSDKICYKTSLSRFLGDQSLYASYLFWQKRFIPLTIEISCSCPPCLGFTYSKFKVGVSLNTIQMNRCRIHNCTSVHICLYNVCIAALHLFKPDATVQSE
jgi:hypothetical protein